MNEIKKNKEISISLFLVIVIIISAILGIGFSLKEIFSSDNENLELSNIETEDIVNTSLGDTVLLIKLDEEQENIKEENKVEEENTKQHEETKKSVTNTTKKSTSSNSNKGYESIGTINIPSLGINYPILSTTTEKTLKISVTKFWGGNPNEAGNLCIIGHNYKNSKFFGKLPNIKNGDVIQITDMNGNTLNYNVYDIYTVTPEDTSCTTQLTNGKIEVTLITCYYENGNAHATKRLIIKARAN